MSDLVLAGRYRLVSRLGSGGMGTVWAAVDEVLRREVAVKEIQLPEGLSPDDRRVMGERAQREARAAALIDHPSVITVHDVVIEDGRPWIVMELVQGVSLDQVIRENGPRSPAEAARIGLRLLDALEAAHRRGVLHRDVKPSNVLLAGDRVVLTDFGIADIETDSSLTRTGALVGSPGYIAPERLREEAAGPESDLWSLGATLYAAVEGRAPFERESSMAVLGAVLTEEPRPPSRSGSLAPLLWYLLNKNPAARLSVEETRQVLQNVAQGRPSGLRDPAPPVAASPLAPPPAGPQNRGKTGFVLAGVGAVALVAVVATSAVAFSQNDGKGGGGATGQPTTSATPTGASAGTPTEKSTPTAAKLDLCTVLTPEQLRRLLPNGTPQRQQEQGVLGCAWGVQRRGLSVELEPRYERSVKPETPADAHLTFVSAKRNDTKPSTHMWGWPEFGFTGGRGRTTPAQEVSGLGDEAYSFETRGVDKPMDKATVVYRLKTRVVHVEYAYFRGAGGPGDALQAARWTAHALARRA
ncbi:serine/threonine-protein kinase [Actinomadura rudentiformis]|uniref:non-specific serine/threonine protein kinase n=1 Tax=Actinomadura rudentiformis TaxID=359158 RepID=A0A6H9YR07_9ACTN|nr:serine/threonine-protein kinase [Actinomadura rudentiformis]KAB2344070.1 serine/threonine protein kinase [Actinomadura rudentiformis]